MVVLRPFVVHEYPARFQKGMDGAQNGMDVSHDALKMKHLQNSIKNLQASMVWSIFVVKNVNNSLVFDRGSRGPSTVTLIALL